MLSVIRVRIVTLVKPVKVLVILVILVRFRILVLNAICVRIAMRHRTVRVVMYVIRANLR